MLVDSASYREWMRGRPMVAVLTVVIWHAVVLTQVKPGIEVRGVVVDAIGGKPVEGVRVTLVKRVPSGQDILNEQAVTDERGRFTLRAPSTGEYTLSASRLPYGFGDYGRDPFSGSPPKWFPVTGPAAGIVVKLWEYPSVAGEVRDENGQPVAGAMIRAMQAIGLGGRQVLKSRQRARTDAGGAYSLRVRPGTYFLAASPPLTATGPTRPTQYYLRARTLDLASPLKLAASQVAQGIGFQVGRERGFTISGIVEVPQGMAGPNSFELYDWPADESAGDLVVATATLSKDGRFSFPPVVAGRYEIRFVRYAELPATVMRDGAVRYAHQRLGPERLATVPDGPTWWLAERVDLVDKDVAIPLRLSQGVRVTGRIIFEGSGPRPDSAILPTRGVYLRSLDYRFFAPVQLGSPREDGSFRTMAVPPGRYVLGMLDSYEGFQLESVKVGGKEVAGVSFDLIRDVDDAVLVLSRRATAVTGRVAGEFGQARFVLVWPQDEALWSASGTQLGRVYHAVTADGPYTLPLFPGTYRVAALAGLPPDDWESPRYLRSLSRFSERLIVPAGQTVVHNPTLVSQR